MLALVEGGGASKPEAGWMLALGVHAQAGCRGGVFC
jgi:hypothetical protein